ncbi:MAG: hypothetical protein ABIR30_00420 [Chitinophagaceae bacterium]
MKRIMLLAAIHALIINQVQKNARSKKNLAAPKITVSQKGDFSKLSEQYTSRENGRYLTAAFFQYDSSRVKKSWSARQ